MNHEIRDINILNVITEDKRQFKNPYQNVF